LSRRLIQTLDAAGSVSVAVRAPALDVAQQALFSREVFAIVDIPRDTEREVNPARIPAYVDSAYFIVFNGALQGILESAADTAATFVDRGNREDSAPAKTALATLSPVELRMEPLYNPTGGYASYVVPAAFVLIIQQTLLMAAAMLTALALPLPGERSGSAAIFVARALAHATIYIAPLALFLIVLPRIYGFAVFGRVSDLSTSGGLRGAIPLPVQCGGFASLEPRHLQEVLRLFIA
jgi:ABC-2 type transport system permease protein